MTTAKDSAGEKAQPSAKDVLSQRQQVFCERYAELFNASKAAQQAGYSAKTAGSQGHDLLKKPEIQAYVKECRAQRAAELSHDANDLVAKWEAIATADPGELVSVRTCACRYCYGDGGEYQWRNKREYTKAREAAKPTGKAPQSFFKEWPVKPKGGYGYRRTLDPSPECTECDGFGSQYVYVTPTEQLSPEGRALLRGVTVNKDGTIKVQTESQIEALKELSKIKGIYEQPDGGEAISTIGKIIRDISSKGSKPPISED